MGLTGFANRRRQMAAAQDSVAEKTSEPEKQEEPKGVEETTDAPARKRGRPRKGTA